MLTEPSCTGKGPGLGHPGLLALRQNRDQHSGNRAHLSVGPDLGGARSHRADRDPAPSACLDLPRSPNYTPTVSVPRQRSRSLSSQSLGLSKDAGLRLLPSAPETSPSRAMPGPTQVPAAGRPGLDPQLTRSPARPRLRPQGRPHLGSGSTRDHRLPLTQSPSRPGPVHFASLRMSLIDCLHDSEHRSYQQAHVRGDDAEAQREISQLVWWSRDKVPLGHSPAAVKCSPHTLPTMPGAPSAASGPSGDSAPSSSLPVSHCLGGSDLPSLPPTPTPPRQDPSALLLPAALPSGSAAPRRDGPALLNSHAASSPALAAQLGQPWRSNPPATGLLTPSLSSAYWPTCAFFPRMFRPGPLYTRPCHKSTRLLLLCAFRGLRSRRGRDHSRAARGCSTHARGAVGSRRTGCRQESWL